MPTKTIVTGLLQDAGGNAITGGTVVFTIANGQSEQQFYRVTGTAALVPNVVNAVISDTGHLLAEDGINALEIWGNDTISPSNSWYRVKFFPDGGPDQTTDQVLIQGITYDLNSPTFYDVTSFVPDQPPVDVERIQANIIPITTGQYTLGDSSHYYASAYIQQIFATGITGPQFNVINVKMFGAVGDGVTDDAAAINAAIASCVSSGNALYIPAGIYKINSALDCHNTDGLMIYGDGCTVPASGLVFLAPTKGTVIKGNTGVGNFMLDAVGSTGLTLRDISFSSLGATTPSSHGIVIGTSTRTYPFVDGGGGAANFQNLAFYLPLAIFSTPIYGNNFNNSILINVWSIGGWGPVLVSANDFAITPPYGTFGIVVQNDGLAFLECVWSTDGTGPCWYFKTVNTFTAVQNYLVTITNGVGYAGYTYAAVITDCFDFRASLEIDYYPSAFHLGGAITQMTLEGLLYNNGATIAPNVPIIAFLDCTSVKELDCSKFLPIMGATPNSNFHYTSTGGATPTITQIQGFKGYFDTLISPNIAFLNATAASTVPFKNCEFNGNVDVLSATAVIFEVNGVFASHDQFQNIFVNGWPIRTDIPALIDEATPSVKYGQGPDRNFLTGGSTTITDFLDGFMGMKITILAEHAITITDNANIILNGSANWSMNITDSLTLIQKSDGNWYEIGRSDNT